MQNLSGHVKQASSTINLTEKLLGIIIYLTNLPISIFSCLSEFTDYYIILVSTYVRLQISMLLKISMNNQSLLFYFQIHTM